MIVVHLPERLTMKKQLTPMPELAKKASAMLPESPWKALLVGIAELHDRAIYPPNNIFDDIWVEIGPGYTFGKENIHKPSFGHWDLVEEALDALCYAPEYAKLQMQHYLNTIYPDGMLPGSLNPPRNKNANDSGESTKDYDLCLPRTPLQYSHPPFWTEFVADYYAKTNDRDFLSCAFEKGKLNYSWWKRERSALEGGFYYVDIVKRWWESGVDDGVRWDDVDGLPHSCLDASCILCNFANRLAQWAEILGEDAEPFRKEAEKTKAFINTELWDEETGFYYDVLPCRGQKEKVMTHDGFWPIAFGIAPEDKQEKVLKHLFDPNKFFTLLPIPSVAIDEKKFCLNFWRGPSWASVDFWILRGMNRNGKRKEAQIIAEKVLNAVAHIYEQRHTVYEFYPPTNYDFSGMYRKNDPNGPRSDYLGHNPLNALYWEVFGNQEKL